MKYNEKQREAIIKESIGKTIMDMCYVEEDRYWVMIFSDGSEMSFRFMAELRASKEAEIYVSLKVKDFPDNPIPRVKKLCTGGCGDMVWLDKNTEYKWSKIPILCLECALEEIGSNDPDDDIEIVVLPESLESLMAFHIKNRGKENKSSKNR